MLVVLLHRERQFVVDESRDGALAQEWWKPDEYFKIRLGGHQCQRSSKARSGRGTDLFSNPNLTETATVSNRNPGHCEPEMKPRSAYLRTFMMRSQSYGLRPVTVAFLLVMNPRPIGIKPSGDVLHPEPKRRRQFGQTQRPNSSTTTIRPTALLCHASTAYDDHSVNDRSTQLRGRQSCSRIHTNSVNTLQNTTTIWPVTTRRTASANSIWADPILACG